MEFKGPNKIPNKLESNLPPIEPIELSGSIKQIGVFDSGGAMTRSPGKPLFEDDLGRKWIAKRIDRREEAVREFTGHYLQALLKDFNVISPNIKIHPSIKGYLSEYIEGLEDFQSSHSENKDIRFRGEMSMVTNEQMQHLVMCIINGDYDRHAYNYGFIKNNLVVLDQTGDQGQNISNREELDFLGAALFTNGMIREDRRREVSFYKTGIDIAKKAMQEGYFESVANKTNLSSEEKTKILADIKYRLDHIDDILKSVFKSNKKEDRRKNKEK